jgi:hypothetical protein
MFSNHLRDRKLFLFLRNQVIVYTLFIMITDTNYIQYLSEKSMFFIDPSFPDIALLIFCGIFSYFHYHFIIKAFEHSSSTVILPFL